MTTMTANKLLKAYEGLSDDEQSFFRAGLAAKDTRRFVLTPEDEAACDEADAQIARGEFSPAAEVFARLRASRG